MPESVLRIYDPAECSADGEPLDWDRCRNCGGEGRKGRWPAGSFVRVEDGVASATCAVCGGYGSLRAVALAELLAPGVWRVGRKVPVNVYFADRIVTHTATPADAVRLVERLNALTEPRCEDCKHPMSDGMWERGTWERSEYSPAPRPGSIDWAAQHLCRGGDPPRAAYGDAWTFDIHLSPCDEQCRHGGEHGTVRISNPTEFAGYTACGVVGSWLTSQRVDSAWTSVTVEASWRPVDVRTLGWPHDLRPQRLAVLCLRCWAERTRLVSAGTA